VCARVALGLGHRVDSFESVSISGQWLILAPFPRPPLCLSLARARGSVLCAEPMALELRIFIVPHSCFSSNNICSIIIKRLMIIICSLSIYPFRFLIHSAM
jgi:hypothetical protein